MKNKRTKIALMLTLVFTIIILVLVYNNSIDENSLNIINKINGISLNLEQTAGMGDYKMVTQSNWPTEGYKYNAELSRCENGGKLSWDDVKKAIVFSGNFSDKCYVYFDVDSEKTLVEYVLSKYTGVQGENNLYYHDSSLANGAGDNNYRYAGPSEEVNNFVCFGSDETPCPTDNLYRIIGVFGENYHGVSGEQLVKLIKYDYANSNLLGINGDCYNSETPDATYYKGSLSSIDTYYWNYKATNSAANTWSTSLLNKTNLNTNFINNIGTEWSNKISTIIWKVGGNTTANISNAIPTAAYQNEVVNPTPGQYSVTGETEYSVKVGLMYVSDYGFAASPSAWNLTMSKYNDEMATSNNWMYM